MPVDLLVELSNEGDDEVFEADAVDLGPGGIGLRAAVLPEVGQRLRCRFEVPGAVEACEAQGEVVWAADAGRWSGSFGVRFDGLDARAAEALDAIAPAPVEDPGTPEELRAPRIVKVRLDGVASAIEGEIASEGGESISIEQAMPFLQIGRGAEIDDGGAKVRAVLERVRLRVENGTPRLVLELAPETAPAEAPSADATIQDEPLESLIARAKDDEESLPDASIERAPIERREPSKKIAAPTKVRREREAPRVIAREEIAASEPAADEEAPIVIKARAFAAQARPALASGWAKTKSFSALVVARSGPWLVRVRDAIVAAWRALASRVAVRAPRLAPMLGQPARRRTTSAPPVATAAQPVRRARGAAPVVEAPAKGRARGMAIGAIAIVAVGLAVYGLASRPEAPSDEIDVHRPVDVPAALPATPTLAVPVTVPETYEPIAPPEPVAAAPTPGWDRAMPEPATAAGPIAAPSYPSIDDRREVVVPAEDEPATTTTTTTATRSMEFGAASVERGRTTALRMSAPVQSIEGLADAGGFTVTVHGALSLDRAAPLAAANSAIERASIINRGDHCVLTIRFVTGRTPPYRVVANGTSLEVTFGR
ncbi:PilZ domain-containing protein [Sandaracinus amylolyticus]|uniref:PilZ domain-containing protein n=1 Tax=Sandaracinus amylolyticus TaxID=927083 RepID=UPI001F47AF48|nr:PilZ domain-containing protein [Sandaracinus amylolyticus]